MALWYFFSKYIGIINYAPYRNKIGKREAVRSLLDDKVTCNIPATLLKLHPDVTVLCDRAALGE